MYNSEALDESGDGMLANSKSFMLFKYYPYIIFHTYFVVDGLNEAEIQHNNNTFDKIFMKELEVEPEEAPNVLFELHENSLLYMDREEWDHALILLQKAQILIEQINIESFK